MNIGIILASGKGERINNSNIKKCFIEVCNRPLFSYSLSTFLNNENIDLVYLVIPEYYQNNIDKKYLNEKVKLVYGGNSRQESVFNALKKVKEDYADENPFILVHDAARALLDENIINEHINLKDRYDGNVTGIRCIDSLIKIDNNLYKGNIDRNKVFIEQTPTSSYLNNFLYAFENNNIINSTDDVTILKNAGFNINLILGNNLNFKVTYKEDLDYLKYLIENIK